MSRGVANTLPVSLRQVANSFAACSTPFQTDTYSPADIPNYTNGANISVPATAIAANIKVWGGGGGGSTTKYGGGGAFLLKRIEGLTPGSSNVFRITVGTGGVGSSGGDGTAGGASWLRIYTGPDSANTMTLWTGGARGAHEGKAPGNGAAGNVYGSTGGYTVLDILEAGANGNSGTSGGNAGGVSYGGGTRGSPGNIPGGGGTPGYNGGNGSIIFEWFAVDTNKDSLVSFTAGANGVPTKSYGDSGAISASAPVSLLAFQGVDNFNMSNTRTYEFFKSVYQSGTANANCKLIVTANGFFGQTYANLGSYGSWLKHEVGPADPTICANFDVRVTKITGGNNSRTLQGDANNTWLNCNTDREWIAQVDDGTPNCKFMLATIEFRRNVDSVVLSSSTARLTGFVDTTGGSTSPPDTGTL
jgi:hypothetical protein